MSSTISPHSSGDLLAGVQAIAAYLNITRRHAYHLHENGDLPTFKVGNKVYARRSTLAKHFARLEREARRGERS